MKNENEHGFNSARINSSFFICLIFQTYNFKPFKKLCLKSILLCYKVHHSNDKIAKLFYHWNGADDRT